MSEPVPIGERWADDEKDSRFVVVEPDRVDVPADRADNADQRED